MLLQRVVTAAVLLGILGLIYAYPQPQIVALIVGCVFFAGIWEWLNLHPKTSISLPLVWGLSVVSFLSLVLGFFVSLRFFAWPAAATAIACLFWLVLAPLTLKTLRLPLTDAVSRGLLGVVLLLAACSALVAIAMISKQTLLAVLLIPVIADTAAYFVGKAFGKRKLAPSISPGKTIEGALGGLAAVALVHGAWVISQGWFWWWILIFVVLAVFSIVGDLFESLLKRQAGVKDSSNLLPGHGGVLDRIDAQLPVLPLAALAFHFLPLLPFTSLK